MPIQQVPAYRSLCLTSDHSVTLRPLVELLVYSVCTLRLGVRYGCWVSILIGWLSCPVLAGLPLRGGGREHGRVHRVRTRQGVQGLP